MPADWAGRSVERPPEAPLDTPAPQAEGLVRCIGGEVAETGAKTEGSETRTLLERIPMITRRPSDTF